MAKNFHPSVKYTKPGEKIVGSKIAYIKTFNFTRENYSEVLKQYRQND